MNIQLIQNRKSTYSIIFSSTAAAPIRLAAEELSGYLEKISGVKLPFFTDDRPESPYEILLGQTNRGFPAEIDCEGLGINGFTIRTEGKKIYLAGGDAYGVLYAVYEFLEKYLGCRFYSPCFEKIPRKERISLPSIDETQKPGFPYRSLYWYEYQKSDELCAKRKVNYRKSGITMDKKYGMRLHYCEDCECHTIYTLAEMTGSHIDIQPCLSDEKVYQTILKNLRKFLQADPEAKIVSVSQNDTHRWSKGCECAKCKRILEETGSYAGSWILLIKRLAEDLKADYPDLLFHTFAYRFTRQPPQNITLPENLIVELCSIESCFRHPLEECGTVGDDHVPAENFPLLLEKWSKLTPHLAIWDYNTNFKNYCMFHPNFEVLRKNIRFFAEHNAEYLFCQGNAASFSGEFGELRSYLLTKLMWDPYMSDKEYRRITEEFIDDYYGKGAPFIKEYIRLGLEYTKDLHVTTYELQPREFPNRKEGDRLLPHPFILEGEQLFAAAMDAESDPLLQEHIERASLQIGYLQSLYGFERLEMMYKNRHPDLKQAMETYRAENRALAEKMLRLEVTAANETVEFDQIDQLNLDRAINEWSKPDHVIPV